MQLTGLFKARGGLQNGTVHSGLKPPAKRQATRSHGAMLCDAHFIRLAETHVAFKSFQVKAFQPHKVSLVWRQPSLSLGAWQPASQRAPLRPCCASCLECVPACMMRKGGGRRHICGRTHHRRAGRLLEVAWLAVVAIRREDRGVLRCLRARLHVTRLHAVRLAIVDAAAAVLEILCLREALLLRETQ